jgi:hypothetical protein
MSKKNMFPLICCSTFHIYQIFNQHILPVIGWNLLGERRDDTQLLTVSKDVCNLFCGWNVMNLNNLIDDMLSHKMVFYGDVLGIGMKY